MRKQILLGSILSIFGMLTLWYGYSEARRIIAKKAMIYARGRIHLNALKCYAKKHGDFPPELLSKQDRQDFINYATNPLDEPRVLAPQFILPIYDGTGEWLAEPNLGTSQSSPVFLQLMEAVSTNTVIVVRAEGTFAKTVNSIKTISLAGKEVILYSGEIELIPNNLAPPEVSKHLMRRRNAKAAMWE